MRLLWAMTTTSPAVTELDWNMLVIINPIIIAVKTLLVMEKSESKLGSPCRGATMDEIKLRL